MLVKKPGVVHMHRGRGKDGLKTIFSILEETDIPIKQFRPTHANNNLADIEKFALMGGYVDFTSSSGPEATAKTLTEFLSKVPQELITLSSDSNGSMPVWNEKNELIGMAAGSIDTLYETVRSMVVDCGVDLSDAVRLITENVAKALNIYPVKGSLSVGADGDLVLLDGDYNICSVFAKGEKLMEEGRILRKGNFEK